MLDFDWLLPVIFNSIETVVVLLANTVLDKLPIFGSHEISRDLIVFLAMTSGVAFGSAILIWRMRQ